MQKQCSVCKISFHVKPSHFSLRITCSIKCCAEIRREKMMGNKNPAKRREVKEKLRGRYVSLETREKLRKLRIGKHKTQETKDKISKTLTGVPQPWSRGEKSNFWRGGMSQENRIKRMNLMNSLEYKTWRRNVFGRDDYTCQMCGQRGEKLNADHIKPWSQFPELRLDINNGRTLCVPCHRKTDTYGGKQIRKVQHLIKFLGL